MQAAALDVPSGSCFCHHELRNRRFPIADIPARRLRAQRLIAEPFASPIDAVRRLGAVQAQDYGAAKWALGQRDLGTTDSEIDRLFDEGSILRTHVLRPTWHFVLPEDIRWILDLTGPRVRRAVAGRLRVLEIDERLVTRANAAFTGALAGGRSLTRAELAGVLRTEGIAPDAQRLTYLLMTAELEGVIVSGPRRGKQFTHALLAERAPEARMLGRAESVAELTRRYFQSHGPAQLQDFVWWSGLTTADARTGIALAGGALEREIIEGKEYWFDGALGPSLMRAAAAHLLPNFDEYTVGYRDRAAILPDRPFDPAIFSFGSILSNVLTVGGRVRGAWRRTVTGYGVQVVVDLLEHLEPVETAAVEEAALKLGGFLGLPVKLTYLSSVK